MALQLDTSQPMDEMQFVQALRDRGISHGLYRGPEMSSGGVRRVLVDVYSQRSNITYSVWFDEHQYGQKMLGYVNVEAADGKLDTTPMSYGDANVETFYRIMRDIAIYELGGEL